MLKYSSSRIPPLALTATLLLNVVMLIAPTDAQVHEESTRQNPMAKEISVDFPGGTVLEYVDMIRQAAPGINVVITGTAHGQPLPTIQLTNVPAEAALQCINRASREQAWVEYLDEILYVEQNPASVNTEVRVMNVQRLLQSIEKEDMLRAIEVGLEMQGDQAHPIDLKMHEETGLFFIKGMQRQTGLIEEIVRQLEQGVPPSLPGGGGFGGGPTGAAGADGRGASSSAGDGRLPAKKKQ